MKAIEQAAQSYEAQGFAAVRDCLPHSVIVTLAEEVDRIFAQWLVEHRAACEQERLVNMHSLTSARYFPCSAQRIRFFRAM